MFDRSKGIVPAQKLSAFYGERTRWQGIPKETKEAIEFCQNCPKPKRKCNGDCAALARYRKENRKCTE